MPATEETYRKQSTLHVVFAVSSIAMTLSIVWMILADHARPWKKVQREFHRIEDDKLHAQEKAQKALLEAKKLEMKAIDARIEEARNLAATNAAAIHELEREIKKLGGTAERLDTEKRFAKAELDSLRSLYDGKIERGEDRSGAAAAFVTTAIIPAEDRLRRLTIEYEKADAALKAAEAHREELLGKIDTWLKKREEKTRDVDLVQRRIEQKEAQYFGLGAFIRNLPGIDLVPPTKIQQISLPDLTINYNFKDVPRYDRCTTCHLGVDNQKYRKDQADNAHIGGVFAAHPRLVDGATAIDPRGNVVPAGLFLDASGPHPINAFGCTICHGGQGSGTDFTYASHEPDGQKQKDEWERKQGWHKIHHWDEPMLPRRFLESSCLKCHHQVTDVPQARKLQAGYERIVRYGCTGCHTIGGEGSFGPDLTDERQVGPNLAHIGSKVSRDWVLRWIKNPHAFRPDSRMPRFYGVTNNDRPSDLPKTHAEIQAITHYLFEKSTPPSGFVDPPAQNDLARGKELFLQKGCLACHAHRPYERAEVQLQDRDKVDPAYKPDKAITYDPSVFPESVRQYARADYGPNLSNIAAKFPSRDQGYRWLANWIREPDAYHPKSLMPNLQLSAQDAADVAAWIVSIPGAWPVKVDDLPAADSTEVKAAIDELVRLYVAKSGFHLGNRHENPPLSQVDDFVARKVSRDDKLMFLGEKTIYRLGCFGCHNIAGFEKAKPIGTPLNGWGIKSPTKLDYAHINEYLESRRVDEKGNRDGTDPYFQEQIADQTRAGFLYQKLHRPRSYDWKKSNEDLKTWDERLRMPQFAWANDPHAVEQVMTFILGLTGEKISAKYLPRSRYTPRQNALAHGAKVLNRYNCTGCHVVAMPKYTIAAGTAFKEALVNFPANLNASYTNRGTDYLEAFYPDKKYDPKLDLSAAKIEVSLGLKEPEAGQPITVEGMPIGVFEDELTVQLWKPATIRGYTFNVGDTLTFDRTKVKPTDPEGGNFAWLFATAQTEKTGGEFVSVWNRLPPPLIREGKKVQTPWLSTFLKDPYPVRPAVNLRMPRFHFKSADDSPADETAALANYFAAVDGAEFPYQSIPQTTRAYLSEQEAKHPGTFSAGWSMMTENNSPCLSCHAIGQHKVQGTQKDVNGPELRQVAARFRPGFLLEWLAKPSRLVPYTAMPQNFNPHGPAQVKPVKGFEDRPLEQVTALRDTLLNYVSAVEQQLAGARAPAPREPATGKAAGSTD
jgi:cbb3-type cytochrome oxidase cytochrome c subunit/peptidoglycan hydrolase CwlO-like protein